jgi:acetyl-CoA acetyltransferase family protein
MAQFNSDDVVFLSGKRTPFGTFNGVFSDLSATELGAIASQAALEQAGITGADLDHVIFGNVMQTSADAIYLARHVGLKVGAPTAVPAVTVNRLCGSGFESVAQAAQLIRLGEAQVVLAGGAENMTQAPHTIRGARAGFKLGGTPMNDYLQEVLYDPYAGCAMAITAENLAEKYGITREEADAYGFRSQSGWLAAHTNGDYADEIVPVVKKSKKGDTVISVDEHPQLSPLRPENVRARFSAQAMAALPPVFKKDGTVTAANASGINDGAGALVMSSGAFAAARGLQPLGRLLAQASVGVEPKYMGIGPVAAIKAALARAGMSLDQMDLVEINEAFSTQVLACDKELGLDWGKTNLHSGGVAVGHPLAASGSRITMHLLYALRRSGKRFGVGSACIGGGQGIAVVVEAL